MQRFQSWDEIEPTATEAERKLKAAVEAGEFCRCGAGGQTPPEPDDWSNLPSDRHIRADVLRFFLLGGCSNASVTEVGVLLIGAFVSGQLSLLDSEIAWNMLFHNCVFQHGIYATRCTASKDLRLVSCKLPFLLASGLKVGGQLVCSGAEFQKQGETALDLQNAEIGQDLILGSAKIFGETDLNGLKTGGQLSCTGAEFQNKGGTALNLQSADIGRDLFLSSTKNCGEATLNSLKVGGQLDCAGAEFQNKGKRALNLQDADIDQSLFLSFAKIFGTADLSGLKTGGQLSCTGTRFQNKGGTALNLQNANIAKDFFFRDRVAVKGDVDLSAAKCGDLVDDPDCWPDPTQGHKNLILDGFTYRRIVGSTDARTRLNWLAGGDHWDGEFLPQPYKQLAKVLHEMGHEADAREVLYVLEKKLGAERRKALRQEIERLRDTSPALGRQIVKHLLLGADHAIDWLQRVTVGYGRKPFRSIGVLAGLILTFWMLTLAAWHTGGFAPNSSIVLTSPDWATYDTRNAGPTPRNPADHWSETTIPGRDWESFSGIAYAADIVVPIIDFGQTEAWAPSTTRGPAGVILWWAR